MTKLRCPGSTFVSESLSLAALLAAGFGCGPELADTSESQQPPGAMMPSHDAKGSPAGTPSGPPFAPALMPEVPQVSSAGGPVLGSPKLFAVTFAGDPLAADLETFTQKIGTSGYWTATTGEYGVGPATATVIHEGQAPTGLTDTFGSNTQSSTLRSWIASKLSGNRPAWGTPARDGIYIVYLPAGNNVTLDCNRRTCDLAWAYHGVLTLSNGTKVVYALIPRCLASHSSYWTSVGGTDLDVATTSTSHELVEAATDPYLNAWWKIDDEHSAWAMFGSELGDMCEHQPAIYTKPADVGYFAQRTWSNRAAKAGRDPCVPQDKPYFNSIPVFPDRVTVTNDNNETVSPAGVALRLGESKTLDVKLFSDGPTGKPWMVKGIDQSYQMRRQTSADTCASNPDSSPDLTLSLTGPQAGQNGDTLHLLIRADRKDPLVKGPVIFAVHSTLDGADNIWFGWVSIQ